MKGRDSDDCPGIGQRFSHSDSPSFHSLHGLFQLQPWQFLTVMALRCVVQHGGEIIIKSVGTLAAILDPSSSGQPT
jgi:hypothetical protein